MESILFQSYDDLEVLIMDDCSPDDTPLVAKTFQDSRVKYIRNEPNLGHLRNYNKGIELARGRYVWLISADDRLSKPYVLERYVAFMERHPKVGYVFCAAIGLEHERETGILQHFYYGDKDCVFPGRAFAVRLIKSGGGIASPAAMTRKECYQKVGMFPLDMPHLADLYLWCKWAFHFDVGYLAEPMVNYRIHDQSMMHTIREKAPHIVVTDDLRLLWWVESELRKGGHTSLLKECHRYVASRLGYYLGPKAGRQANLRLNEQEFEDSLQKHLSDPRERAWMRGHAYIGFADRCYQQGDFGKALDLYTRALRQSPFMPYAWIKYALSRMGNLGIKLRGGLTGLRQMRAEVKDK